MSSTSKTSDVVVKFAPAFTPLRELFQKQAETKSLVVVGQTFQVCGHVRSAQSKFVHLYDGTTTATLQLVFTDKQMEKVITEFGVLYPSTTLTARVTIVKSQGAKQPFDGVVIGDSCRVLGQVRDPTTFLPAIKNVSMDTWRKRCDQRVHSRTQAAIFRIRSRLSWATHEFMKSKGVFHLDPNTITSADCEGAGEMFIVTTLGEDGLGSIPTLKKKPQLLEKQDKQPHVLEKQEKQPQLLEKQDDKKEIDWRQDFFRNDLPCRLTVSSQLQLEALTPGVLHVYTTNPSYRAEKSTTTRHLASFTHVEAELSFIEFKDLMDFEEEYVVFCISTVLKECAQDLAVLEVQYAPGVTQKLKDFIAQPFARMSYDESIEILNKSEKDVHARFPEVKKSPKWGEDLGAHCERYLAEVVSKRPAFVYNMPASLKSFYMRRNKDGKTVQGCDLLIPGMGELIGGSMRENNYYKLVRVMVERKMCKGLVDEKEIKQVLDVFDAALEEKHKDRKTSIKKCEEWLNLNQSKSSKHKTLDFGALQWYVDLRRNASTPTGGFGVGFERLVTVCTSSLKGANIRDSLPFPVAFKECRF